MSESMNKKNWKLIRCYFYCLFLTILFGCGIGPSVKIKRKLSIFANKPKDIRSMYTPYRWSVVEDLYSQGEPVKTPTDFPTMIEFPNRHNISGSWSTGEASNQGVFYPSIWNNRDHKWRKLYIDNYYIVKAYPITGYSTPSMGIFKRREDKTWEEIAWIYQDMNEFWEMELDYCYNLHNNIEDYHSIFPWLQFYLDNLLEYSLYLIGVKKRIGEIEKVELGEIQELDSIVERLHFWGEHIEKGLFGMQTNRDDLTELAKEMREHVLLEWTKVAENYYILLIRYQEKEEDWSKIAHAYAILEYKEKEKIYHCHYISGKLRGIEK